MQSAAASPGLPGGVRACLPHKPGLPTLFPETALTRGSVWEPLCSMAAPLGVTLLGRGRRL